MISYSGLAADIIVLLHFGFLLFVALGGFLLFWRRWLIWFHLPAVLWGAVIEFSGWICPLTPLENILRNEGENTAYQSGFIDHNIMPLLYPADLSRSMQLTLGLGVLILNAVIYRWVWNRTKGDFDDI